MPRRVGWKGRVNPLTPMSDQSRISPYNINTSFRKVMRIKKNINLGIVDPILNSLNKRYKNCMVDSKENYKFDVGIKRVKSEVIW